jgi:hypothetical protein
LPGRGVEAAVTPLDWGYSFCMKFRTDFGALGFYMVMAGFWFLSLLVGRNHSNSWSNKLACALILLGVLFSVFRFQFVYWELSPQCFREHRFGTIREIPWHEVTQVVSIPPNKALSKSLVVEFCHNGEVTPFTGRDRILATPGDRDGFVAELRRFAPQADFEA